MDVTIGLLVIALAATAEAVTGFGFALVAVPLLAPVVGVQTAVPTAVVIVLLLSSWARFSSDRASNGAWSWSPPPPVWSGMPPASSR